MEVLTPNCHPERSEGSAASVSLNTAKKLLLGGQNAVAKVRRRPVT
jgi:hypothetical protein